MYPRILKTCLSLSLSHTRALSFALLKITLLDHVHIPVYQGFKSSFHQPHSSRTLTLALTLFNSLSLNFLIDIFFFSCLVFFLSSNLRIPRLKKKKKLTIPDISICLAISLETCHVNNNAQLYTIRPSFTAAYSVFRKNTLLDSPIHPDSNFSRASHATTPG